MKQKIVIKVSMNDQKSRSKALKTVVGVPGVESAALTGNEKDQLEVVGEGVDAVALTRSIRKNVAHADLVSVGAAKKEEEKKDQQAAGNKNEATPQLPLGVPYFHYSNGSYYPVVEVREPSHDPECTIM